MSLIAGIHHVSLTCVSEEIYEKACAFYGEVLELPKVRKWDAGIMFGGKGGIVEIFRNGEDMLPKGTIRHFAFSVSDPDACAEKVRAAGYEVFIEPKDVVIASDPAFPIRIAFCRGPLGEEIEFFADRSNQ